MSELPPDCEDAEVLDEEPKSILLGIIAQLRKGGDLHRITLPTFVLEPRSMLERMTDFWSHPHLIIETPKKGDAVERFIDVIRFYLSGWHIRPKGVKKPYNSVLGEIFRCKYDLPNGTKALFVSEQVSHHPPRSTYYYASPENGITIHGNVNPKSKFLGNSAATLMQGKSVVTFLDLDEQYIVEMPNVYARGILFGKMTMELGDVSTVVCEKNGLRCDLDFKTKGFFGGTYNAVAGKIFKDGKQIYEISGKWSDVLTIKKEGKKGDASVLFDVKDSRSLPMIVAAVSEQWEFESRRLWHDVTKSIIGKDLDAATTAKTKIEDDQRTAAKHREEEGIYWKPHFFHSVAEDNYQYTHNEICKQKQKKAAYDELEKLIFQTIRKQ